MSPRDEFDSAQHAAEFSLFCMTDGEMPDTERKRLAAGVLADLEAAGFTVARLERLQAAEAVCEALDAAVESLPHINGAVRSTVDDVRREADTLLDAVCPSLDAWRARIIPEETNQ